MRDCAILAVFFSCGLRRNDITTLSLKSINEQAKLIFVAQSKGRQDRIVPIAPEALELVTYYRDNIRPKLMNFSSGDYLFLNNSGLQYTGGQITELINKYKRRAGVSKPGASNLYRHTTATTLLDNGADLLTVQKVLGHASVSTTQIYTHVAVRKMSDDYQKFHPAVQNSSLYIPFNHPIAQSRF
ncbi:tyrosine-type recombinase/integrase [Rheinheimera muenzenbergensis]|uniref:tyrosine-type recombinase/integrase n=1 Tax=Rheinheimera muenzenbergensis TaxID=1193628 RepID=UPI003001EDDA